MKKLVVLLVVIALLAGGLVVYRFGMAPTERTLQVVPLSSGATNASAKKGDTPGAKSEVAKTEKADS